MDPREFGDALEPELRLSFLDAVDAALQLLDAGELVDLIRRGQQREIVLLVERLFAEGFVPSSARYVQAMLAAATAAGASAVGATGMAVTAGLERLSPRVLEFVRREGGARVTGLGLDAIRAVQEVMERGITEGIGAQAMGRRIRQSIGLLPSHSRALEVYAAGQERLVEAGTMREATATRNVETYRRRLLNYRAEMIARTEAMNAAHGGLVEGWRANIEAGWLPGDSLMQWVVTEDDRACERCVPMDGQRVRVLGGVFEATVKGYPDGMPDWGTSPGSRAKRKGGAKPGTKGGDWRREDLDGRVVELRKPIRVAHPPLHPNCRCSLVLVGTLESRGVEQPGSSPAS
jgi:hypothetical protein